MGDGDVYLPGGLGKRWGREYRSGILIGRGGKVTEKGAIGVQVKPVFRNRRGRNFLGPSLFGIVTAEVWEARGRMVEFFAEEKI